MLECGISGRNDYLDKQEILLDQGGLGEVPRILSGRFIYTSTLLIDLSSNNISEVPSSMFVNFPHLLTLNLEHNKIKVLPSEIGSLGTLKSLRLSFNFLKSLPHSIYGLEKLEILTLSHNLLVTLPGTIGSLAPTLRRLNVSHNRLKYFPAEMQKLSALEELAVSHNPLVCLPCFISDFPVLQSLELEWPEYLFRTFNKDLIAPLSFFKLACIQLRDFHKQNCSFTDFILKCESSELNFTLNEEGTSNTYLHKAAFCNHLGVLEALLKQRPKLDIYNSDHHTPLGLAIRQDNYEAAKLLLEAGASPNIDSTGLGTPFHQAVFKKEIWLVKEIILIKGFINGREVEELNTPLHTLLSNFDQNYQKSIILAELLMDHGAKPNLKNNRGWTPAQLATKLGQLLY